jgi:hypothetical protein
VRHQQPGNPGRYRPAELPRRPSRCEVPPRSSPGGGAAAAGGDTLPRLGQPVFIKQMPRSGRSSSGAYRPSPDPGGDRQGYVVPTRGIARSRRGCGLRVRRRMPPMPPPPRSPAPGHGATGGDLRPGREPERSPPIAAASGAAAAAYSHPGRWRVGTSEQDRRRLGDLSGRRSSWSPPAAGLLPESGSPSSGLPGPPSSVPGLRRYARPTVGPASPPCPGVSIRRALAHPGEITFHQPPPGWCPPFRSSGATGDGGGLRSASHRRAGGAVGLAALARGMVPAPAR